MLHTETTPYSSSTPIYEMPLVDLEIKTIFLIGE